MKLLPLLCLGSLVASGCTLVEDHHVTVKSSAMPHVSGDDRIPLAVALVLDKDFTTYGVRWDGGINLIPGIIEIVRYPVGKYLRRYAEATSQQAFRQVLLVDSPASAKDKADIILIPKVTRSSTNITTPIQLMMIVQWEAKDHAGIVTRWVTSIESEASERPLPFLDELTLNAVYQRVFDDLTVKTAKAFLESRKMLLPGG